MNGVQTLKCSEAMCRHNCSHPKQSFFFKTTPAMQPVFDGDTGGHLSHSALPGDPHSLCYTFLPINFFKEGL